MCLPFIDSGGCPVYSGVLLRVSDSLRTAGDKASLFFSFFKKFSRWLGIKKPEPCHQTAPASRNNRVSYVPKHKPIMIENTNNQGVK